MSDAEKLEAMRNTLNRQRDRCFVNGRNELKACKEATVAAIEENVPQWSLALCMSFLEEFISSSSRQQPWAFVRQERHLHRVLSYGCTASSATRGALRSCSGGSSTGTPL